MSYAAHAEALKHLSDAGCEVLEIMEYTARNSGLWGEINQEECYSPE